jgi:SAM-dependent methyltransferase
MTLRVLRSSSEIAEARRQLIEDGASGIDDGLGARLARLAKRFGLYDGLVVGDRIKSWDVLETVDFLAAHVRPDEPILDIGCYASEVLISLKKRGYRSLNGVDLNPRVTAMPFAQTIRYAVSDFMATPFADASMQAITSISVIEHGLDAPRLMDEVARLLRPDGYFIASFDYWPEKIDTAGVRIFGMDWLIFSREDVERLIGEGGKRGLEAVGEIRFEADERPVRFSRRRYTFGWLALRKKA